MGHGWWVVTTHFMAQLFMTGLYAYGWSLLAPEVAGDLDSDMRTMNYVMTASGLLGLAIPPIVGPLVDRWSARGLMLIGTGALALGMLGMSLAPNVQVFAAVAALCFGLGNILLGPMTGSAVISRFFTETRGRALGVSAMGTSLGGVLIPQVMNWGFEAIGWRATLQALTAAVCLIVVPLLIWRFRDHPVETKGHDEASRTSPSTALEAPATNAEFLRRRDFWVLSLSLSIFIMGYTATLANLGAFVTDRGFGTSTAASLMSMLAAAGLIGKLFFGELIDRLPLKLGLWSAMALTMLALGILASEPGVGMLRVAGVLLGFATGGLLPVWNALVAAVFGVANFGRVMGLMGPVIGIVVSPGFTIAGTIRESTGSYVPAFLLFLGIIAGAFVLLAFLRVPTRGASGSD